LKKIKLTSSVEAAQADRNCTISESITNQRLLGLRDKQVS